MERDLQRVAIALLQAGLEAYDSELAIEQAKFRDSAARMRPEVSAEPWRTVEFRHRGQNYELKIFRLGPDEYRVDVDGHRIDVHLDRLGKFERGLTVGGEKYRVVSIVQGAITSSKSMGHRTVSLAKTSASSGPSPPPSSSR